VLKLSCFLSQLRLIKPLITPSRLDAGPIPALSLDDEGRPVPPPDPMRARAREMPEITGDVSSQPAAKAKTTHLHGFTLDSQYAEPGSALLVESDLATTMRLPTNVGDVAIRVFSGAAYRAQRLSPEEAKAFEPLRDDPKFYRQRTAELHRELLEKHKPVIAAHSAALAAAALLLRDPGLVNRVRADLRRWIVKSPDEVRGRGFPNDLCDVLAKVGTVEDFKLFHELVKRHPEQASRFTYRIPLMAKRLGLREAEPVLLTLLDNDSPMLFVNHRLTWLLRLDKTVPEPSCGDAVLHWMTQVFGLKPSEFGMSPVEPDDFQGLADRHDFGQRELANMRQAGLFDGGWKEWVMRNGEDRRRGVERMRTWISEQTRTLTPPN